MTREDTIKLAREAGFVWHLLQAVDTHRLERFATLVADSAAAKEREACAALADRAAAESHSTYEHCISVRDPNSGLVAAGAKEQAKKLSEAIRARGQQ